MTDAEPAIRVNVDPANPGQFFACCGLLELADRLWQGVEGWFEESEFCIQNKRRSDLPSLMLSIATANLCQLDTTDDLSSPLLLGPPFHLRLDWWLGEYAGGRTLKVWAGRMSNQRIARAMQVALKDPAFHTSQVLNRGIVVREPEIGKKVEPFYFDARRSRNAHARDIGFSPNDLQLTTIAFPAVEFLCLVGLQRCLPAPTPARRIFKYYTWEVALLPALLPSAVCGLMPGRGKGYRFENGYRSGQKKHKAFLPAESLPLEASDADTV